MSRALHERLDPFGLAVAGLVAAMAVPSTALVATWRFDWSVQSVALLVLLGGPAVAVAVWPVVPDGLATRLAASRLQPLAVMVPLGYLVPPAVVIARDGTLPTVVVGLSFVGAIAGLVAGLGVWVGTDNRYAAAMTDDAAVLVTWSARPDPVRRTQLRALTAALVVLGLAVVVAALVADASLAPLMAGPAAGAVSLHQYRNRPREFTATSDGLSIHARGTVHTRFLPWSRFRGFSRTVDALVLHRRVWPSLHCAVADVDDPDAVVYALERNLERLGA